MIQSMYSGAAGLKAHQTEMDVIGNNIANVNTIGFKESRAEFQEALNQTLHDGTAGGSGAGGTNPMQVGLGVSVGSISTNQAQGAFQNTGRTLDVAIEGNGFLTLSDGNGQHYTRDGALSVDSSGNLVGSSSGLQVMGWNADASGKLDPGGALSPIKLPLGQLSIARPTSNVSYAGNLDAGAEANSTVNTTYKVYDAQGGSHDVDVTFTKTANPGEWTWSANTPGAADGTAALGTGSMTFGTDGKLTAGGDGGSLTIPVTGTGAAASTLTTKVDFSTVTSLASAKGSTVSPASQDGMPSGTLTGYAIEADGTVTGTFSNGMTQPVAQIGISNFANPGGLARSGGNLFSQAPNAGLPQVGAPGTGGRGKLASGSLEMSNVDLSTEFTSMIIAQRGFQANSRIITTSDEMLQELISLKR